MAMISVAQLQLLLKFALQRMKCQGVGAFCDLSRYSRFSINLQQLGIRDFVFAYCAQVCITANEEPRGQCFLWLSRYSRLSINILWSQGIDARSAAMTMISVEQLQLLLKFALQRMKCQGVSAQCFNSRCLSLNTSNAILCFTQWQVCSVFTLLKRVQLRLIIFRIDYLTHSTYKQTL